MIRSLALVLLAANALAGCNVPRCGKGTVPRQSEDGTLTCQPVDAPAQGIDCDTDGGTLEIVAGHCASKVKCDDQTAMYDPVTGFCIGTGMGNGCPPCQPPGPNQICVTGNVYDFASGMQVMSGGRSLRIAAFEPLSFLANPNTAPLAEDASTTKGCFTLTLTAPASGLVAIAVTDPVGANAAMPLTIAGAGAQVQKGKSYKLDGYMILKSLVDGWSAAAGQNYGQTGVAISCFYKEGVPPPTANQAIETMPATGVAMLDNGTTPATAKYLAADRTVNTGLTTTGPIGCGILPGTGMIEQFSGSGGGITKWETLPGSSTIGVAFVNRFHSCDMSPGAATCL